MNGTQGSHSPINFVRLKLLAIIIKVSYCSHRSDKDRGVVIEGAGVVKIRAGVVNKSGSEGEESDRVRVRK